MKVLFGTLGLIMTVIGLFSGILNRALIPFAIIGIIFLAISLKLYPKNKDFY